MMITKDMEDKKTSIFNSNSPQETKAFVDTLFSDIETHVGAKPIVFLLKGDLGAGKTQMTKFIAQKLGITDMITSPTFTICREYRGEVNTNAFTLYHIDTYRFEDATEFDILHPKEIFQAPNVAVLEWADKVQSHLTPYFTDAIVIDITITVTGEESRRFYYTISL